MAVGDTVSDLQSIAAGADLTLQPGSGVEWYIQNIIGQDSLVLSWYDGTSRIDFQTSAAAAAVAYLNTTQWLTNGRYLKLKNNAGTAKLLGYSGVIVTTGSAISDLQSIASGADLTVQPAGGHEWLVHNIMGQDGIVISWTDGTSRIDFFTSSAGAPTAYLNTALRLNGTRYLKVKNNAGTAKLIGYSGVQTK